jgi:adenosylhomocysteine nucleosidase
VGAAASPGEAGSAGRGLHGVGIVVGLAAEARLARPLGGVVAVGGGAAVGARRAAEALADRGVTGLVSFGLAGGLDPALPAGAVLVPGAVWRGGRHEAVDATLARALGGVSPHVLLCGTAVVFTAAEKARLWRETGCAAVDLETGAVASVAAARGLAFAVLRVVCDPAGRGLPPAALVALDGRGAMGVGRVLASVLARPRQVPALLGLAREATVARRALAARVALLGRGNGAGGNRIN